MTTAQVTVKPIGKKSGAWIIKGDDSPPPATNGIEVFYGEKSSKTKKA